jgi:hypothetical protein
LNIAFQTCAAAEAVTKHYMMFKRTQQENAVKSLTRRKRKSKQACKSINLVVSDNLSTFKSNIQSSSGAVFVLIELLFIK